MSELWDSNLPKVTPPVKQTLLAPVPTHLTPSNKAAEITEHKLMSLFGHEINKAELARQQFVGGKTSKATPPVCYFDQLKGIPRFRGIHACEHDKPRCLTWLLLHLGHQVQIKYMGELPEWRKPACQISFGWGEKTHLHFQALLPVTQKASSASYGWW